MLDKRTKKILIFTYILLGTLITFLVINGIINHLSK